MNGIMKKLALGGVLVLMVSSSFANTETMTNIHSNWYCTTNASSAANDADKAADKKMSEMRKSSATAFAFAQKHCRDCTKITCEADTSHK